MCLEIMSLYLMLWINGKHKTIKKRKLLLRLLIVQTFSTIIQENLLFIRIWLQQSQWMTLFLDMNTKNA